MSYTQPKIRIQIDERGLKWNEADAEKLCDGLTDCQILAADPIDYPCTDGLLFLIGRLDGSRALLEIGVDPDGGRKPAGGLFYARTAVLPKNAYQLTSTE